MDDPNAPRHNCPQCDRLKEELATEMAARDAALLMGGGLLNGQRVLKEQLTAAEQRAEEMASIVSKVLAAMNGYELALKNRQHGGVAADNCLRDIREALEITTPAASPPPDPMFDEKVKQHQSPG